jgi:type II secretory pathway pseudopilin PulG
MASRSRGYTYLMLLFAVLIMGMVLSAAAQVWHTQSKREKEADLLFIGDEFRRAIMAYQQSNANTGDGYPKTLEALLQDPNAPVVRRFLRQIYVDPMTGKPEWGLIRLPTGGIAGVYSLSKDAPIKTELPDYVTIAGSGLSYSDWKFGAAATPVQPSVVAAVPGAIQETAPILPPQQPMSGNTEPPPPPASPFKEKRCQLLAANDQQICAALEQSYGQRASTPCFQSADVRAAACQAGTPIPLLVSNVR